MKTDTLRFRDLLQKDIRLLVPLFQRPYVWNQKDQWEPFWEDIRAIADDLVQGRFRRPHFLGAIVLEQVSTGAGDVETRLVIDGQQRLTTAQLVLEAFHDLCTEIGAENPRKALAKMTRIDDPMADNGESLYKVWPTTVDQEAFRLVMDAGTEAAVEAMLEGRPDLAEKPIVQGYQFFCGVIREWIDPTRGGMEKRVSELLNAVRDHMRFVVIDLEDEDDAQLIFETLNARGTPLLPTDLVKNFIFHRARVEGKDLESLYGKYWQPFDEWDDWWRKQVGRGHAQRARIDLFLQAFLTVQTRGEVPVTHVYATCRDHIVKSGESAEFYLRKLHDSAEIYGTFESQDPATPAGRFFRAAEVLDVTSIMPVALELFTRFQDQPKILNPVLRDIESFLIRRMVCGLNTRGYNRLFVEMLDHIKDASALQSGIRRFLLKSDADSSRWPTDEEFRDAWVTTPVYKILVRKRVKFLLECLEREMRTAKSETFTGKLNIEHLLPQDWLKHWPLPWDASDDAAVSARNHALQTVGNLTLLTTSLNPSVSNGSWAKKCKEILKYSALSLNRDLINHSEWDESAILKRSKALFQHARKAWPHAAP